MWQPSGSSQTRPSSISRDEIHVLVVDHEREHLIYMSNQLKLCSYKVTTVECGRAAMSMLIRGKQKFDLLLADINLPDLDAIKLLQVAVHSELPSILMSDEYDKLVAEMAIDNGAILFIQKPFTKETSRNFWQIVMREKRPKLSPLIQQDQVTDIVEENRRCFPPNKQMVPGEKVNQTDDRKLNGIIPKRAKRKKNLKRYEESDSEETYRRRPRKVKRKTCTEWTEELHARFVSAVNHLGDGRCYPKDILDLMNVPGLTRMQVASHLQKCRNDDWRLPHIRKSLYPHSMGMAPTLSIHKANVPNPRKFGSMPVAKKRIIDDKVQNIPKPSTLENQSIQQDIQTTLPLSQAHLPSLPPPLENINPTHFMPTRTLQMNVDGPFGGFDFLDSTITIPTMDNPSSDFVIDSIHTVPPAQQEFGAATDTSSFNQEFDFSAFSDLNINGDFLPDLMDDLVDNINGLPEPSLTNYPSSRYQQFVDDFTSTLSDQNATPANKDTSGLWSMETSNVFDQP